MLALALGRPLAIEDTDCDVEIPVELDDEQLPQYFAGALLPQGQITLMRGTTSLPSSVLLTTTWSHWPHAIATSPITLVKM